MTFMIDHVVTHGGAAHLDEFLCVCVHHAHSGHDSPVYRRDPTDGELDDPKVLVLDVGSRYQPELSNFDHHQEEVQRECAFSLYAKTLKLGDDRRATLATCLKDVSWYQTLIDLDNSGPEQWAVEHETTTTVVSSLRSPVDRALLMLFANAPNSADVQAFMRTIGHQIVRTALLTYDGVGEVDSVVQKVSVEGISGVYLSKNVRGLKDWCQRFLPSYGFNIQPSTRGAGLDLYREDRVADQIDFRRIKDKEGVEYVHKNGFLARISSCELEDALIYIRSAMEGDHE